MSLIQISPDRGPTPKAAKGPRASTDIRPSVIAGYAVIVLMFGGLGGWAATAPLASAVIAHGTVAVESNKKIIQHYEGGIVSEILVREAQPVTKGQVLLRLDKTQTQARADLLQNQLDANLALEARLVAERDDKESIVFPAALRARLSHPTVAEAIADQQQYFAERRNSLLGKLDILRSRITQLRQKIAGLEAQRSAMRTQVRIFEDELVGLNDLHQKGYFPRNEILAREREKARLEGEIGRTTAAIAEAHEGISEADLQIKQTRQDQQEKVVEQLRQTREQISDLQERLVVADDSLKRIDIVAPLAGIVQNLKVHTISGVVSPGETLLEIVPVGDELVVNAKISPLDIDNVRAGQEAEVRFSGFSARETPTVQGRLLSVSSDQIMSESGGKQEPYFLGKVIVGDGALPEHLAKRVVPGMPVDVLIQTRERTVMDYLSSPLSDMLAKSLREE